MGGKSSTATSSTGIPQEVLDRYNAVNAQAQAVAQTPFQQYSQDASAFVAPLTSTQTSGIQNTNQMAGAAQPFYGAATGLTLAGTGPANAGQIGGQEIGQYMSPYLNSVVGTTMANLRQQQQQEQSGELGNQISRGAFGGDRGRIAQANLARQQNLATGQTVSGLMNQGYGQALQTAQQQQGVNLGAEQANLARLMQGGQQIAGLGAGAQAAGLQGAQAQLAAGTAEQQTNQAGQTALYNQFLQQQGYPFQVAQFLANIAMGTGALSGQTTTTQQPSSFFSDKRLKEDIEPIGETYDGQKIVKFRYKGEPGKQIGLIAQDVEKHHPEAVGLAGGYKTVDYDKATKHAADKGHYLHGGLVPQSEGGAVYEDRAGQGYAKGGETSVDMAEILALLSPQKTRTPYGKIGLYGQSSKAAGPYGSNLGLEDPRGLAVRPVRDLALDEPGYVKKPAFAYGGLAPDGYASGGLPYNQAEGEYVPEDISDMRQTPAKLDSPKSVPGKSGSDFQTAMDMAKIAAMFMQDGGVAYASGGLVPHMADGGSPDFATLLAMQQAMYGNMPGAKGGAGGLNIPQQMQRRPEMLRPSPMASNVKSSTDQTMADLNSVGESAKTVRSAYDAGKEGLYGSAGRPELRNQAGQVVREEEKPSTGLISSQEPGESGHFKQLTDYVSSQFASGGLVPRHGYADGMIVTSEPLPDAPISDAEKEVRDAVAQQISEDNKAKPSGLANVYPFMKEVLPKLPEANPPPSPERREGPYSRAERIGLSAAIGLGDMLGSDSRYFGTAFGRGIAGGAKAYKDLVKDQSELGRQLTQTDTERYLADIQSADLPFVPYREAVKGLTAANAAATTRINLLNFYTQMKKEPDPQNDGRFIYIDVLGNVYPEAAWKEKVAQLQNELNLLPQRASGGLVSRHGYATDGTVVADAAAGLGGAGTAPSEGGLVPAPMTTQERLREKAEQDRRDAGLTRDDQRQGAEMRGLVRDEERVNTANAMIQRAQDARNVAEAAVAERAAQQAIKTAATASETPTPVPVVSSATPRSPTEEQERLRKIGEYNIRAQDEAREDYRQRAEMKAAAERETAEKAEMDRVARLPRPVPYVSEPPPNAGSFAKEIDNPDWLNTEITRLNRVRNSALSSGVNPEAIDRQITERKADLAKIMSGEYVPLGTDGKPITWYKQQAENYAINQKTLESMQAQDVPFGGFVKSLDKISDVFKTFAPGAGADAKAAAVSFARSVGFDPKDTATANPTAVAEIMKYSTNALFDQMKQAVVGTPLLAEVERLSKTVPESSLQPKANREILSNMKGTAAYIMKFNKDYQDAVVKDKNLNKNLYSSWWMKQPENDAVKITKEFYATTPVRGELTRNTDWNGLTKGHQYVLDENLDKRLKDNPTVYVFTGFEGKNPIFKKVGK